MWIVLILIDTVHADFCTCRLVIKFNLYARQSKRLTTVANNIMEQL